MDRRQALKRAGAFAFFGAVAGVAARATQTLAADAQVVKVVAKRFEFTPSEIALKSGQPAVLEITSLDFIHGFNLPALKLRTNLLPGPPTKVALPALAPGRYDFLCDNFCGGGHEDMNGTLVVT
ncbi:MAG TPA: cupredoxin domain-containing protein [Burkholderiales bacterium]|nr:cupredoxin domain-containing protein [Burkholderiales bacterium]